MTWHPSLADADPAAAWFEPDELAAMDAAEQDQRAFDRMIERRERFERAVRRLADPSPEDVAALWHAADEETTDAHAE